MKTLPRLAALMLPLLLAASLGHGVERETALFVEPPGLEPDIQFWMQIYTEVDSESGLLHDYRNIDVVYGEIDLPRGLSTKAEDRYLEKEKDHYRKILKTLATGKRTKLSPEEKRVLALFPPGVSNKELKAHVKRIRFQQGQADRFRAGLVRSGAYADHIQEILGEMGLPPQLAALPHVESSYSPEAYSRIGASGLWQFTRATGRRFMRVDQIVDERRDPYKSTAAAARLLAQNLRATGSWPLAITAYNHGASGMRRASRKLGHKNIEKIIREYKSRRFGFASRNFYVEFIAASRIAEDPEAFFGPISMASPTQYETIALPFYISAEAMSQALDLDLQSMKAANPSLLSPIWNGQKRIPRGFEFKVPVALLKRPLSASIATLPRRELFTAQTRDSFHIVRRGETLSAIAQKYRVPVRELASLNDLRDRNRIRVGQKLRLPIEQASTGSTPGELVISVPEDGLYTVRRGDNLTLIALRFGVDDEELLRVNDIRDRHRINAGQVLRLPGFAPTQPSPTDPGTRASTKQSLPPGTTPPKTTAPSSPPPNLRADPSDYLVAGNETIEVQFGETLGHYAEWLDIRAQELRTLNGLSFGEALPIHSRLRLNFKRVSPSIFERQRIDYHLDIQEQFFSAREIVGTRTHKLQRGDSIWVLAHQKFKVPLWLLQQYNPDVDFETAPAGTAIVTPVLEKHAPPDNP
ncbi:MAG: LysM peptidoglycan-binding domain-containing protein [Myxococcota bacterium]|jgi:membrane-bound lytic murein transglycosylase D|nr:LysM peptidoglycan-binding domain-containing protein [Myxococcota bacterium]